MKLRLSKRALKEDFQSSFVKIMLEVAAKGDLISFAGGLPNPKSFPVEEIKAAVNKVLDTKGAYSLQYNSAEGYGPLREFISNRYKKQGIDINSNDILITNGSQQALDIISSCLIDPDDDVLVEDPSYLAALQSFHLYNPNIHTINLNEDGADINEFKEAVNKYNHKFFYSVPNFQNPTGITYTNAVRESIADIIKDKDTFFIEDNPYGELRFRGEPQKSLGIYLGEQAILLGTFSKTVVPGMRLGWIACRNKELYTKMKDYKQLIDLHTSTFSQLVVSQYLEDNDYDEHIKRIIDLYGRQCNYMLEAMNKYFPSDMHWTHPEGGMFIWASLPKGIDAVEFSRKASDEGVAVAAGEPFYEAKRGLGTVRLNYTNSKPEDIDKGILILSKVIEKMRK
ncbi:PLP-dependent aminotransferase family protein [uncultured Brachyspira sp.]|uniref:aminotransferase-like domain-containing protein n=1 Tax=uncultured Brachyspira sp. TaxID=221953 RepID=UPI0025F32FD5|nr:PLP-dependent aminotransferase family protein [uncultured Brachyspira sp.]